jgi:hypothetical protein
MTGGSGLEDAVLSSNLSLAMVLRFKGHLIDNGRSLEMRYSAGAD